MKFYRRSAFYLSMVVFASLLPVIGVGQESLGAPMNQGLGTSGFYPTKRIMTRGVNRMAAKRIKLLATRKNPFANTRWSIAFKLVKNTCPGAAKSSFGARFKIDSNLVGTDTVDGSPFFKGKTSGTTGIQFGRQKTDSSQCRISQYLSFKALRGNSSRATLDTLIDCSSVNGVSCSTRYQGTASK